MLLLQAATILFAVACAWLNRWPVVKFRESGLSIRGEKDFHAANAVVKIFWASIPMLTAQDNWILTGLLLLLVQWLAFDIALNLFTGKPWFYLGQTSRIDKVVRNGKRKAIIVIILIIGLNLLLK